jgi:hypothetical protein
LFILSLCKTQDGVVANAKAVVLVIPEYFKSYAVETIQPVARTDPHKSFFILDDTRDHIIG